jgi:hypothetical protein
MADADAPRVLDLTNEHLRSLEDVAIAGALEFVDLTANRLTEFDPRLLALTGLKALNLRQNLLGDVAAWNGCACKDALEDLEFRDNQIKEVPQLTGFTCLTRLELSYNEVRCPRPQPRARGRAAAARSAPGARRSPPGRAAATAPASRPAGRPARAARPALTRARPRTQIRSIAPLEQLGALGLRELFAAANKVAEISGVQHFSHLTQLELGSNRIRWAPACGLRCAGLGWAQHPGRRLHGGSSAPAAAPALTAARRRSRRLPATCPQDHREPVAPDGPAAAVAGPQPHRAGAGARRAGQPAQDLAAEQQVGGPREARQAGRLQGARACGGGARRLPACGC